MNIYIYNIQVRQPYSQKTNSFNLCGFGYLTTIFSKIGLIYLFMCT